MGNDANSKRKLAILGVSGLMLVVVGAVVSVGVTNNKSSSDAASSSGGSAVSASMKSIESMCAPTDYKETCVKTLKKSGTNSSDPKDLIKAGFNATMKYIRQAATKSQTLKEVEKDPMAKQALRICKELMEYSIDELEHSFVRLGSFDITKLDEALEDLNIWLSAVSTYQETCLDGFKNVTTEAGTKMKKALNVSMELTTNALAMIGEISAILGNLSIPGFNNRRLLQLDADSLPVMGHDNDIERMPTWMDLTKRKLLASNSNLKPDLVVAKDGSGKYKTITEALKDIPLKSTKPFVLHVKAGIYNEQIIFGKKMNNVVLIGDGPTKTRIVNNKNYADGVQTFHTATVSVLGIDFMAKDIGFENSAGAIKHQAVALLVKSEKSVFYNCHMDGYQDTLYAHTMRQFYRDCTITGTIDFVFGNAAAIFQNCKFLIRKPLENQQCIVTAQGRKESRSRTAIVLQGCTITGDPSYMAVKDQFRSYLGRPWKKFSRTVIMQSNIDSIIQPEGWLPWLGSFGLDTLYYTEYNNRGPGANTSKRVAWKGIRHLSAQQIMTYTPRRFLLDDAWINKWGIPYTPGMLSV